MAYQKCPICNGVGQVSGGYYNRAGDYGMWVSNNTLELCRACSGAGLIDEVTGMPPKTEAGPKPVTGTDPRDLRR